MTTNGTDKSKIKTKTNSKDGHKNRGLKFEQVINNKLLEYRKQNLLFVQKIPTEYVLIRAGAKIVSAFPKKQTESVDFLGAKEFLPIGLEAKETANKTSFPLSNIEPHQIKFFQNWCNIQGVGYYLIRFSTLNKVFLVDALILDNEIKNRESKEVQEKGDKSLKLEWFEHNAIELNDNLDFLQYIEEKNKGNSN